MILFSYLLDYDYSRSDHRVDVNVQAFAGWPSVLRQFRKEADRKTKLKLCTFAELCFFTGAGNVTSLFLL